MRSFIIALALLATPAAAQTATQQAPASQTQVSNPSDPDARICNRWKAMQLELKEQSDWWDKKKKKKKPDPELDAHLALTATKIDRALQECRDRGY